MNLVLEKTQNGFYLNLFCMGEKPRHKINFWNLKKGKWLFDEKVKCVKRFESKMITASIIGFAPYVIYNEKKEVVGSTDRDILLTLGEFMNFDVDFKVDIDWGRPSSNGTWNGLLGKVRVQKVSGDK